MRETFKGFNFPPCRDMLLSTCKTQFGAKFSPSRYGGFILGPVRDVSGSGTMIPPLARFMHLSVRVRTGRLPFATSGRLQVRLHTSSRPRLPKHEDASHVSRRFVVGALLTFGTLGFGLYALQNGKLDHSRPLTLGAAHDTTHPGSDHSSRHVHHQNKVVDSSSDSQLVSSSADTITLSSSYGTTDDVDKAIEDLRRALPGQHRVQTNKDSLQLYGSSENSYHPCSPHSVIVQVKTTEDVVKVVDISRKYRIPLVPYSGATSLEGHFSGVSAFIGMRCSPCLDGMRVQYPSGSICIDLSGMDQILEINGTCLEPASTQTAHEPFSHSGRR